MGSSQSEALPSCREIRYTLISPPANLCHRNLIWLYPSSSSTTTTPPPPSIPQQGRAREAQRLNLEAADQPGSVCKAFNRIGENQSEPYRTGQVKGWIRSFFRFFTALTLDQPASSRFLLIVMKGQLRLCIMLEKTERTKRRRRKPVQSKAAKVVKKKKEDKEEERTTTLAGCVVLK
ncbi:hypothetical protein PAMP_023341 [Pampus punctatissimus]